MHKFIYLLISLSLLPASALAEDALVLFRIQAATQAEQKTDVIYKSGLQLSPLAGKKAPSWWLVSGTPIQNTTRPRQLIVTLYHKTDSGSGLLGSVVVKYYRSGENLWTPHFQFSQEQLFMRAPSGAWQPKQSVGMPEFIEARGATMPNGEGFYPALELRALSGPISIDGWQIGQ